MRAVMCGSITEGADGGAAPFKHVTSVLGVMTFESCFSFPRLDDAISGGVAQQQMSQRLILASQCSRAPAEVGCFLPWEGARGLGTSSRREHRSICLTTKGSGTAEQRNSGFSFRNWTGLFMCIQLQSPRTTEGLAGTRTKTVQGDVVPVLSSERDS